MKWRIRTYGRSLIKGVEVNPLYGEGRWGKTFNEYIKQRQLELEGEEAWKRDRMKELMSERWTVYEVSWKNNWK